VWHRSGPFLNGNREQPSSNHIIQLIRSTKPPFGHGEHACPMVEQTCSTGQHDPRNLFVVVAFGHGTIPMNTENPGKVENVPGISYWRAGISYWRRLA
jgi:hypothetical protein